MINFEEENILVVTKIINSGKECFVKIVCEEIDSAFPNKLSSSI